MNKQEIQEKLISNHRDFVDYILSLNESDFMFSINGKWTAGQQLDHILRAVLPVKTALSLPKFIPKILFGKPNRSSTSYEHLVSNYQGGLALGGKASKKFVPPQINFDKREVLKIKLLEAVDCLSKNLDDFSENQLDEHLLPHPIIGKLTMREMLYFTIYHVEHHHKIVVNNLD